MRNVISTVNLAAPYPDYPAILAGVPTLVPEDDPWIKQMLDAGKPWQWRHAAHPRARYPLLPTSRRCGVFLCPAF